jgi:diguanylate cyclase (GGDEF)-like protein
VRILIADDSIVSRHLLEATLRKWGYEVVVACDGAEALRILQEPDSPALAILDWVMPGVTGPEVCRQIRQQGREQYTYILLLTSKSLKEDLIAGMEAGADDYITKPFDQHELKVRLRAGTRIVELQTELLATRESLREQATKDFLTHIWNRSSVLEIFERELARSQREMRPLGVVLADIDHFKKVNDTYGHFAGDAMLRETARRMQSSVRPYDSVGRYGGEEFLIILPGCDIASAGMQAERLRQVLRTEAMSLGDVSEMLTCSFGATAFVPQEGQNYEHGLQITPEMLIRVADQALYSAKNHGRDRVVTLETSTG